LALIIGCLLLALALAEHTKKCRKLEFVTEKIGLEGGLKGRAYVGLTRARASS
jgi:hypothetical protein